MEKSYKSKYDQNITITPAQYIVEIICERIAKKHQKGLPYRFWEDENWAKIFKLQIILANRYLKQYTPETIIRGLNSKRAKNVFSLGAKFILDSVFQDESKKEVISENSSPNPEFSKEDIYVRPRQTESPNDPFRGLD